MGDSPVNGIPASVGGVAITGKTGLDTGLSRTATKANLDKAARQFESVFTGMMMKSMRQAKLADPLFDSKALTTFRDMSDQKVVQEMATHKPIGIGAAMSKFLAQSQPDLNGNHGTPVE